MSDQPLTTLCVVPMAETHENSAFDPHEPRRGVDARKMESRKQTRVTKVEVATSPEGSNGETLEHRRTQAYQKRGRRVRQDIIEKMGFEIQKPYQLSGARVFSMPLYGIKWNSTCTDHHEGSKRQNSDAQTGRDI